MIDRVLYTSISEIFYLENAYETSSFLLEPGPIKAADKQSRWF